MQAIAALLLAHFLADFVFQSNAWVADKYSLRNHAYLKHGLVVAFLNTLALMLHFETKASVIAAIIIGIVHSFQDRFKIILESKPSLVHCKPKFFVVDQLLHIALLVLVVAFMDPLFPTMLAAIPVATTGSLGTLLHPWIIKGLLLILATVVTGIALRIFLDPLAVPIYSSSISNPSISFWIGICERLLTPMA